MEAERKMIRSQPQSVPDRLSELPDSLLLKILSSMEMTDVVKTGILSKRWKSLWTKVDTLVYKFHLKEEEGRISVQRIAAGKVQTKQYISFINTSLRQHQSNIRRFSYKASWVLMARTDVSMSDLFDYWIECVLEKKVEDLEFDFEGLYHPPDCLFHTSSSLTKLKLVGLYSLEISMPVKLNLLKTLCLRDIALSDQSMKNILSGCPVLESLSLAKIENLECVDIVSPRVQKLKLDTFWFSGIYSANPVVSRNFRIRAPWLRELEISGPFLVEECRIEDLSSIVKATLTFTAYDTFSWRGEEDDDDNDKEEKEFNANWIDMAPHLLKAFSHVAELSIGKEVIQVLSLSKLYGKPSPSFQCKHLTINSPLWQYDVLGMSCLLENTPHLETLVINVSRPQGERPFDETRLLDDEDMDLSLSKGNFLHLKNVKIDYNRNPCKDNPAYIGGHCNDVEIVGYIMRSAAALERLVLCSSRPGCTYGGCSKVNCSFMYVPRLSSELLTNFLSGNEAEEWELKKRKYSYEYRFSNYACQRSEVDSEEVASC